MAVYVGYIYSVINLSLPYLFSPPPPQLSHHLVTDQAVLVRRKTCQLMSAAARLHEARDTSNLNTKVQTLTIAPFSLWPGIATESPGIATESPGIVTESPGIVTESPGIATESPGIATKSPGIVLGLSLNGLGCVY